MKPDSVNLLLVEDNHADARLVRAWLEDPSVPTTRCHHVSHLRAAVDALQGDQFDAVLLDMSLPDSEGLENVDRIREIADNMPIVVLTGRDDEAFGLKVLKHGAQDYLVKGRHTGDHVSRSVRYAIERKRLEEELVRLAHFDPVTQLANRVRFVDRVGHAVARAKRRGEGLAVLYLDLDGFKQINDTFGHAAGDWLLHAVGQRLEGVVRDEDTVARLGGDEFGVLIEALDSVDGAETVARKLLTEVGAPYEYDGNPVSVGASIGIALFPESGMNVESLMHCADIAMYRTKQSGRNGYQCFTAEMKLESYRQLRTEQALENALEAGEFELLYQPRVDAVSRRIVGLEALLRWRDMGAMRLPGEFVPLLERSGLISTVGDWVVESVCRQIIAWRGLGYQVPLVSINLSGRQLRDPQLPERLQRIFQDSDIAPDEIELEITETLFLGNDPIVAGVLNRLRGLGCPIAVDDFGAGYCSFAYLRNYSVDVIKVDRSFIAGITAGSTEALLVGGIVRLARDLSLRVVIEGIETAQEVDSLRDCCPDEFQGFMFHPPMGTAQIEQLLGFCQQPETASKRVTRH